MIRVLLTVKFRAFGITFGSVNKEWHRSLGIGIPIPSKNLVDFNERGVRLIVEVV
jgi:hypothetical protein